MIKYIDPFQRETIIDILPSLHNDRVGFVVRKERQSVYESWTISTTNEVIAQLRASIKDIEEK